MRVVLLFALLRLAAEPRALLDLLAVRFVRRFLALLLLGDRLALLDLAAFLERDLALPFAFLGGFFPPDASSMADQSTVLVAAMPGGSGTSANRQRSRIWILVRS